MPHLDGHDALARIREKRPGVPTLLMSGYAELGAPLAPDAAVLVKPFAPGLLLDALRDHLGTARSPR